MSAIRYRATAYTAKRVRNLARRSSPANRAPLLKLSREITATGTVRIRFTRDKAKAIDLEAGTQVLIILEGEKARR